MRNLGKIYSLVLIVFRPNCWGVRLEAGTNICDSWELGLNFSKLGTRLGFRLELRVYDAAEPPSISWQSQDIWANPGNNAQNSA